MDTLIATGVDRPDDARRDPDLLRWLARTAVRARRVVGLCTGSFVLAEAGLLDGRSATTHWAFCDELTRRFPAVTVQSDPIFVRDGSVYTSAGATAGVDLVLALVEEDLGRRLALAVAQWMVVFLKRPGARRARALPRLAQEPWRAPDLLGLGPDAPLDASARRRFFGED